MPVILALALLLLLPAVGGEEPHTVWEDEDAAREEALSQGGLTDDEGEGSAQDEGEGSEQA